MTATTSDPRYTAEASTVETGIVTPSGREGSAVALAEAAEAAGRDIHKIEQKSDSITGGEVVRVWVGYRDLPSGPVPEAIHDLLTEWGYEPSRHHGPETDAEQHVYHKEA